MKFKYHYVMVYAFDDVTAAKRLFNSIWKDRKSIEFLEVAPRQEYEYPGLGTVLNGEDYPIAIVKHYLGAYHRIEMAVCWRPLRWLIMLMYKLEKSTLKNES